MKIKKINESHSFRVELVKNKLFGIGLTQAGINDILEYISFAIDKTKDKFFIVTPNPEMLVYAAHHSDFADVLNKAKIALIDGVGLILAGKILSGDKKLFINRITGVDFIDSLCKHIEEKPITVGFLGGVGGVANKTADCLLKKYPGLKVVFISEEWPSGYTNQIDILFVAFGFPKQEQWMVNMLPKLSIRIAIGVGGAFDYISGNIPRAPKWIRNVGGEWLYRLYHQPWRLKRQFALGEFIYMVLKEKIKLLVSK